MSRNGSEARTSDWRTGWVELSKVLEKHCGTFELYHSMLLTENGSGTRPEALAINRYKSPTDKLVQHVIVPLGENATEEHFFYADSRKVFDLFQQELNRVDRLLLKVPVSFAPRTMPTGLTSRSEDGLIRWIRLLFFLSLRYPTPRLETVLYCTTNQLDDGSGLPQFILYEDLALIDAEFDPCESVFGLDRPIRELDRWRNLIRNRGEYFPEMFATHFSKELFYASSGGIENMLLKAGLQDHKPVSQAAKLTKTEEFRKMLLLCVLKAHHTPSIGDPTDVELSRAEISIAMRVNPARVTKALQQVFKSGGYQTYKRHCLNGTISRFLEAEEFRELGERLGNGGFDVALLQDLHDTMLSAEESED